MTIMLHTSTLKEKDIRKILSKSFWYKKMGIGFFGKYLLSAGLVNGETRKKKQKR